MEYQFIGDSVLDANGDLMWDDIEQRVGGIIVGLLEEIDAHKRKGENEMSDVKVKVTHTSIMEDGSIHGVVNVTGTDNIAEAVEAIEAIGRTDKAAANDRMVMRDLEDSIVVLGTRIHALEEAVRELTADNDKLVKEHSDYVSFILHVAEKANNNLVDLGISPF